MSQTSQSDMEAFFAAVRDPNAPQATPVQQQAAKAVGMAQPQTEDMNIRMLGGVIPVDLTARPIRGATDPVAIHRDAAEQDNLELAMEYMGMDDRWEIERFAIGGFRSLVRSQPETLKQLGGAGHMMVNNIVNSPAGLLSDQILGPAVRRNAQMHVDMAFSNLQWNAEQYLNDPLARKTRRGGQEFWGSGYSDPVWWAENAPSALAQFGMDLAAGAVTKGKGFAIMASARVMGPVYEESYAAAKEAGYSPTEAHWMATSEATVNGVVSAAINRLEFGFLSRTPAGQALPMFSARRMLTLVGGGAFEAGTEGIENITEISTRLVRKVALGEITMREAIDQMFSMETVKEVSATMAMGQFVGTIGKGFMDGTGLPEAIAMSNAKIDARAEQITPQLEKAKADFAEAHPDILVDEADTVVVEELDAGQVQNTPVDLNPTAEAEQAGEPKAKKPKAKKPKPKLSNLQRADIAISERRRADTQFYQFIIGMQSWIKNRHEIDLKDYRDHIRLMVKDITPSIRTKIMAEADKKSRGDTQKLARILRDERLKQAHGELVTALKKLNPVRLPEASRARAEQIVKFLKADPRSARKKQADQKTFVESVANPETVPIEIREFVEGQVKAVKDLTRTEAEQMLREIEGLRDGVVKPRDRAYLDDAVQNVVAELAQTTKRIDTSQIRLARIDEDPGFIAAVGAIAGAPIENLPLAKLGEYYGGGKDSTMAQMLGPAIFTRERMAIREYRDFLDAISATLEPLGLLEDTQALASMSADVARSMGWTEAKIRRESKRGTTAKAKAYDGVEITPFQRAMVLAMMRDPELYDKAIIRKMQLEPIGTTQRINLTPELLTQMTLDASEAELALVNTVVDYINTRARALLREASSQEYGKDMTRPGTFMFSESTHSKAEDLTMDRKMQIVSMQDQEIFGRRQETNDASAALVVPDILTAASNYMWKVSHITTVGPTLRDAFTVMNASEVRGAIRGTKQQRLQGELHRRVEAVVDEAIGISGESESSWWLARTARRAMNNSAWAVLAANMGVAAYQVTSILPALAHPAIKAKYIIAAMKEGAGFDSSIDDRMYAESDRLWLRSLGSFLGLQHEGGSGEANIPGVVKGQAMKPRWQQTMMGAIIYMDVVPIRMIWRAAEIQQEVEGVDAINAAEEVVWDTQAVWDAQSQSGLSLMARKSLMTKFATVFRSQLSQIQSEIIMDTVRYRREEITGGEYAKRMLIKVAATQAAVSVIGEIRAQIMNIISGDGLDDPADVALGFLQRLIGNFAGISVIGTHITYGINRVIFGQSEYYGPMVHPVISTSGGALYSTYSAINAMSDGDAQKAFAEAWEAITNAGALYGVVPLPPVRAVEKAIDGLTEDDDGDAGIRPIR